MGDAAVEEVTTEYTYNYGGMLRALRRSQAGVAPLECK